MKILVTGGAGFIGSHVVDALVAAGHGVAVLDDLSSGSRDNVPPGVPLHVADIRDAAAVARAFAAERPDAVCHQAAQMSVSRSVREPLFDARVNCIGLINILDAAVARGARDHWSCIAVRSGALERLRVSLRDGDRAMHRAFAPLRVCRVPVDEREFANINTRDDLAALITDDSSDRG